MGHLTFHFFDVVVAAGIAQALIMVTVWLVHGIKSRQSVLFSCILLTLAVLSFKILLHTLGLWDMAAVRYFPLAIDTLLPPLLYLYVLSVTGNTAKWLYLYLLPTLVFMSYAILVYLLALRQPSPELKDQLANRLLFNSVKTVEDITAVISAVIYWGFASRLISLYRTWLFNSQSDTRLMEYKWLKNLLILSGLLILTLGIVVLSEDILKAGRHDFIVLQCFYIYLAIITYYLSLKGYRLYMTSAPNIWMPTINEPVAIPVSKTIIGDQSHIRGQIIECLERDKLYLNPELSLKDLAQHIGYPAGMISAVINAGFRQNFRSLVNGYRVTEVKERLKDPPAHLSLLGIALDCGFNSEASFYRIFRQETGVSPSDYCRSLK
jgi:AraC-like DNA-binding protein